MKSDGRLFSCWEYFEYKVGENIPSWTLADEPHFAVNSGVLHIFLHKSDAEKEAAKEFNFVVLPVRCYYKDVLCVGKNNIWSGEPMTDGAGMAKVHVELKSYEKALGTNKANKKKDTKVIKTYYKVVSSDLTSARISETAFRVHYKIGEWTYPTRKGTKIFVFDDLQGAKNFINDTWNSGDKIFECEVKSPCTDKSYFVEFGSLDYFWNRLLAGEKVFPDEPLPGTVFVDAVKLLKEIK
jgi:hypothetical protein